MVGCPVAVAIRVIPNKLVKIVDLCIHVIQVMEDKCFQSHGDFGTAVFQFSVVADDHVFDLHRQLMRECFPRKFTYVLQLAVENRDALYEMTDHLAFVGIAQTLVSSPRGASGVTRR